MTAAVSDDGTATEDGAAARRRTQSAKTKSRKERVARCNRTGSVGKSSVTVMKKRRAAVTSASPPPASPARAQGCRPPRGPGRHPGRRRARGGRADGPPPGGEAASAPRRSPPPAAASVFCGYRWVAVATAGRAIIVGLGGGMGGREETTPLCRRCVWASCCEAGALLNRRSVKTIAGRTHSSFPILGDRESGRLYWLEIHGATPHRAGGWGPWRPGMTRDTGGDSRSRVLSGAMWSPTT